MFLSVVGTANSHLASSQRFKGVNSECRSQVIKWVWVLRVFQRCPKAALLLVREELTEPRWPTLKSILECPFAPLQRKT